MSALSFSNTVIGVVPQTACVGTQNRQPSIPQTVRHLEQHVIEKKKEENTSA
jgi:hypothetical protein